MIELEVPNLCIACQGKKVVRTKRKGVRRKKDVLFCPVCFGTGKLSFNKKEAKKVAHTLVAKLLKDALQVGFHLERINELSMPAVHEAVLDIYSELKRKGAYSAVELQANLGAKQSDPREGVEILRIRTGPDPERDEPDEDV